MSPFRSKAQERYFNANRAELEKSGVNVQEYNEASKGKDLPERVKPKKKKMTRGALGIYPAKE